MSLGAQSPSVDMCGDVSVLLATVVEEKVDRLAGRHLCLLRHW